MSTGAFHLFQMLFGSGGDDDFPFWLALVRANVVAFWAMVALALAVALRRSARRDRLWRARWDILACSATTLVGICLRFGLATPNLLDQGGIPYSRLLYGYRGHFGAAQLFAPVYELTARDIEHAIALNEAAGALTVPGVYVLCRALAPRLAACPAIAAIFVACAPAHIVFSASDALSIATGSLAIWSYALLALGSTRSRPWSVSTVYATTGALGLALVTQIRYENVLFLLPLAIPWLVRRGRERRSRLWLPSAVVALLVATYSLASAGAGSSFQGPFPPEEAWQTLRDDVLLNPFFSLGTLLVGSAAVMVRRRAWLGWAMAPWAFGIAAAFASAETGHHAARVLMSSWPLLAVSAAWGFSLVVVWKRAAKWVVWPVIAVFAMQPLDHREHLRAEYVEMVEHQTFRRMWSDPVSACDDLVVPDDELMREELHSGIETFGKYEAIAAGARREGAPRLIGLTELLDGAVSCGPRCCFFAGLPCDPEGDGDNKFTSPQCVALRRAAEAAVIAEERHTASPFAACSIRAGEADAACIDAQRRVLFSLVALDVSRLPPRNPARERRRPLRCVEP